MVLGQDWSLFWWSAITVVVIGGAILVILFVIVPQARSMRETRRITGSAPGHTSDPPPIKAHVRVLRDDPRYAESQAHWRRAQELVSLEVAEYPAAASEAVRAVETMIAVMLGTPGISLETSPRLLVQRGLVPTALAQNIDGLRSYVRGEMHEGWRAAGVHGRRAAEAIYVCEACEALLKLLMNVDVACQEA
ncbi:MAG: hypothetical protein R2826_06275 [Thermoleophilia bacterium]